MDIDSKAREKQVEMTEAFLIRQHEDLKEKSLQFVNQLLKLELAIKELKEDIKDLKKTAKVEGIGVKEIVKALNVMKKERKTSETEKQEVAEMVDFLESEQSVTAMVDNIVISNN